MLAYLEVTLFTWKDECDEAGGDGHGSKDEGGDDRADLSQGRHSGRQCASDLKYSMAI